jgi:dTDP-4-dehydrorhamnose reductase
LKKKRELKIVVTGAAGMLGTAMIDFLSKYAEVVATDLSTGYAPETVRWYNLDLFDHSSTASWLTLEKPNVVIHCAAMVNVDGCEKKPGLARELHVETTKTIAQAVSGWNGKLIYISTDSVFNGLKTGPYSESDPVDPPNQYALTKHGGEGPVLATPKGVVLRTNIFG